MNTTTAASGTHTVESAADQAHRIVDRAREKAAPVVERASTAAHRTIDTVANATTPAAEWITVNRKQLASKSTELADACTNQVRARPFVSVAAALAIGYLIGKLMQR
jgi:ElaB/YqjD/DUF883 family membrane-anchored ribosome-binding protein